LKKILKTNPFLLIFFIIFLISIIFLNSPLKDKFASKSLKFFLTKFLKTDSNWERLNLKIFPPSLSIENFYFPYGKIEKISLSPSYNLAHTKVFVYGMELNLKSEGKGKGSKYGFVFFEELILQKCKLKFEDKEIPLEGDFKDISLFFFKDKGFFKIRDAKINLPEIKELNFSLRSTFKKENKGIFFENIFIKGKDFSATANGNLFDLSPSFLFNFNLRANLKNFLGFLEAGIDGNCNLNGKIEYKNDLNLIAKGNIESPKFLEKEIPSLDTICKLNLDSLNINLIKDNNNGTIKLSFSEKNLSEFQLKIPEINIKDILSFFSIPQINYSKKINLEGKYNFYGTKIEKGEGYINISSKEIKGKGILKDFLIEKLNIEIEEREFKANLEAKLPFSSSENFTFFGNIKEIDPEDLKNILKPFLPNIGKLKGKGDANFEISGTYEDVLISSNLKFNDFYYEDIPFGEGFAEVEIYKENINFKKIFFKKENGILEGSGNIREGINFEHKNWNFPIPFNSILTGEGKMAFEPSFLISGNVKEAKIYIYSFDNINFSYNYDGEIFNLKELEATKGKGAVHLKGIYKEKFSLEGNTYDFPLFEDVNISSNFNLLLKEKDINFCADGLIKKEGLAFMPLNFYSSLKDGNFELELKNPFGFDIKTNGYLNENFDFRCLTNFNISNLKIIPFLKFDPSLKGEATIQGNLKDLKSLKGQVNFQPFELIYKDSPFHISNGINIEIRDGYAFLKETPVFHELAYIEIYGNLNFYPKFKLKIFGDADFGDEIVNYFIPQLSYSGMASLKFSLEKAKDFKVESSLNISGYKLSWLPINFNLLNPKGKAILSENKIKIENFEGNSGDGNLNLKGEVLLAKNLNIDRININGECNNLKVSYLEGLIMFLNGKANFIWTERSKQISGDLSLQEGSFTKEINLLSEIQKIFSAQKTNIQTNNLPQINLNLSIDVPNNLKVKNQLLNLICGGKIQILGDISSPIILGQLETLPKSEIYFNGVLYKIDYARVLMTNPINFDPIIEMEATTNIRSYLIHLKIKGTLSHLTPQFSSEPYLTEADIISLLATGKVASQESGTWLSGASLLISQQISEELSKRSSSIFGLDRIRIEPVFGESNITTARITALKQINSNCTLSYTYNPVGNQKDIISLECNVSQDTYLNLIQEEDGTYLLQIFQRKSL